ncbi:hypothetical protein AAFF_G00082650 [Aldrovandia affinis]|uniref:Endonuclease/exonuclease/phosphatase domain-containing protein n=1 Tax=Aldrovandia affinis TaxID=143900 RepID=A0AAD7WYL6_9TELE|nr:hypothetical protein AAFF_G00082650 [Aldrovandia affinis]
MSVYSPTNVALIEELERFYDDLRTAIHHVPAHNFLIILGDFNARLGPEDAPFTYHTNTNRNGEHLAALLTEHELLAANTLFRKRMGKRWTFRTEPPVCGVNWTTYWLRLSLRVPKSAPRARPDWEAFAGSPELQANYTAEVRGRLHLLAEEGEPTTYERFLSASEEATRKWRLCGADTGGRGRSFVREGTAESQEELNGAKQQLFSTYDRIKGEELMEKVKKVETVHGERRYKESWKVINEMSGRKRSREGQLAGCSPEERVTSWFTHFRDLLGTHPTVDGAEEEIPAVLTSLEIDDGPFTATEFATVKSTLKEGKSAGPDGIPPRGP